MTSYHKTSEGYFSRCRAVTRKGAGVTLCPIGASNHKNGMEGIAASGGGVLRRWVAEDTYRETKIIPNGDGTFEAATGKRKRVFTMDGKLLSLPDRLRAKKMGAMSDENASRSDRVVWVRPTSALPKFFRDLMGDEDVNPGHLFSSYTAKKVIGEWELALRGETGRIDPQGMDFHDIPDALSKLGASDFDMESWKASRHRDLLARHYPNALAEIESDWDTIDLLLQDQFETRTITTTSGVRGFFGFKKSDETVAPEPDLSLGSLKDWDDLTPAHVLAYYETKPSGSVNRRNAESLRYLAEDGSLSKARWADLTGEISTAWALEAGPQSSSADSSSDWKANAPTEKQIAFLGSLSDGRLAAAHWAEGKTRKEVSDEINRLKNLLDGDE